MKKTYSAPAVYVEQVKIEKGFAASQAVDTYSIQDFSYEDGTDKNNTAW